MMKDIAINNSRDVRTVDESLQSKVISFLRFPLIVGVVLIHTQITTIKDITGVMSAAYPFDGAFPVFEATYYLCAQIISRIAVPLFFMFSGFLFFYNSNNFTAAIYISKLKKRVRTLLIPYLFWNILFIVFYNISGAIFPGSTESIIGEGYTIKDWFMILWNRDNTYYPVSYQFWFIRDLMAIALCSPLVFWLTKSFDYIFPLICGMIWLTGWLYNGTALWVEGFFFFTLGAYFSITNKNFVVLVQPHVTLLGFLYLTFVLITFYTKIFDWVVYVKRLSILAGVAFAIALSAICIVKARWNVNSFLSESSFFIYAYHIIALPIIRRGLFSIIPCTTDIRAAILYFLWAAISIILGLILYYLLKKLAPRTTAFITGSR